MRAEFIEVDPRVGVLIGIVILLGGLLFPGWKSGRLAREIDSYDWIEVPARIIDSSFRTERRSRGSSSGTSITYFLDVSYEYDVQGVRYTGTFFDMKGRLQTGLKGKASRERERIRPGVEVPAFHHPKQPSQAVLQRGITEDSWVRLTIGAFLLFCGGITLRYQIPRLRSMR